MHSFFISFITSKLNKLSKADWYSEVFIEADCDETYQASAMIATACIINVSTVSFNILIFYYFINVIIYTH